MNIKWKWLQFNRGKQYMLCSVRSLGSVGRSGSLGKSGSLGIIGIVAASRKYCESIPAYSSVQNENNITIKGSLGNTDNATTFTHYSCT